jgi:glycosyltransferase involved in cell wall biosynthesis
MIKLSILICTVEDRKHFLDRLLERLNPQKTEQVEILINVDKREKSIGQKRNELLDQATGSHIAFIDDDDLVSPTYCKQILDALASDPDCVGIEGTMTVDGHGPRKFIHSLRYKEWFERRGVYYRNPNHLSPVRREFAVQTKFPDSSHGEDHNYSMRLLPLLKREEYIRGPIYFYEYRNNK